VDLLLVQMRMILQPWISCFSRSNIATNT
jgi:hypothetical protein